MQHGVVTRPRRFCLIEGRRISSEALGKSGLPWVKPCPYPRSTDNFRMHGAGTVEQFALVKYDGSHGILSLRWKRRVRPLPG